MAYHSESSSPMLDDDSPWLDDPEHSLAAASSAPQTRHDPVSQQEWEKLSLRYSDAGYRDGITSGKSSHLQTGFDQGFTTASPFAREVGSLRGIAATLLAILTTASGAKHAGNVGGALGERNAVVVGECRALVTALGKLDEQRVLPVDQEAEEHAKSHADEGLSLEMLERKEMRRMEEAMNGLGSGKKAEGVGLEDCRGKLEDLLKACGLEGVMPRRI